MQLTALMATTRRLTNTNSGNYNDADLTEALNEYVDLFTSEILNSMDDWDFGADYATANLVAGQQEYLLPSDILKFKRVEVTFDGSKWWDVAPFDVNETKNATDSTSVDQDFFTSQPKYDLMDNSLFLYPIPASNITAGLKIWYEKLPAVLATSTDEPTFARPFHKGLCYGAAKDYFEKYLEAGANSAKAVSAGTNMETYIARMNAHYRRKNQDRTYDLTQNDVDYGY